MLRAGVLLLAGCNTVFALDDPRPAACAHADLRLCLPFEDNLDDGLARDFGEPRHDAKIQNVGKALRQVGQVNEGGLDLRDASTAFLEYRQGFDLDRPSSIDLWLRVPNAGTSDLTFVLDNNQQYTIFMGVGLAYCQLHVGDAYLAVHSQTVLVPGQWHHVACVLDGDVWRMSFDGASVDSTAAVGDVFDSNEYLRFGRTSIDPPDHIFVGQIDNLRLWDRALTDEEIARFAAGDETE